MWRELLYWGPLLRLCLDAESNTPLKGTLVTSDLADASSLLSTMLFPAQVGSSHLIHSQSLPCSADTDAELSACRSVCPQTSTCFSHLVGQVPAKPLQSSPTGKTCVLQGLMCFFCCNVCIFHSSAYASATAASHGPVSSTLIGHFWEVDHSILSDQLVPIYGRICWKSAWKDWGDQMLDFFPDFHNFC